MSCRKFAFIWLTLGTIALYIIGSLSVAGSANAQSAPIAAKWRGTYFYPSGDNRTPVPFTLQLRVDGAAISGHTSEPATFGNGSSPNLYANIIGTISGTNFSFTKTYDGTGGVSHAVQYHGAISSDGASMSGTWNIRNFGGSFTATAVDADR